VAQQLEGLKLSEDQAEAIIEKGIEYGAYSDEMPDTKKEKMAAADEIVAFSVDAYVNDEIRSDDDDPQVAESGAQIEEILDLAGVEIDDDGTVTFGEPAEAGGKSGGKSDGGEAPFDPDDYIEGYTELSVVTKLKKVRELNPEDDDDAAILEALRSWENEQDKPSSRVLNYIDETLGEAPAPDNGGDTTEEPWDGYDKASAVDIKKVLTEAQKDEDDPLTLDQVQYVLDYEQSREKPPPRKRIIDFCTALIAEMQEEGGEDKPTRSRARGKKKDDEPKGDSNGVIVLTREQILTALDSGEVTIEV
jgi:hypothetical protein